MPQLSELVAKAEWWAAPNPYRPTPDDLVHIFTAAKCQSVPSPKNAEDSLANLLNGVYLGPKKEVKHWCGIFAVCVCNEVGLNLRWDLSVGKIKGEVDLTFGNKGVRPGDIAGVAAHQHHFLVTGVGQDGGSVQAVEGNTLHQLIKAGSAKPIKDIVYYYRPKGLT